jgi:hypothetical protein
MRVSREPGETSAHAQSLVYISARLVNFALSALGPAHSRAFPTKDRHLGNLRIQAADSNSATSLFSNAGI